MYAQSLWNVHLEGVSLRLCRIGQTIANPALSLYALGESTEAGRLPACSRPACGSKSRYIASPLFGAEVSLATIPLCRRLAPLKFPHEGWIR